jgi:hypothetical protein
MQCVVSGILPQRGLPSRPSPLKILRVPLKLF